MEKIIFQGRVNNHPLVISDQYPLRNLRFTGDSRQSCINLFEPHLLQLAYTRWMLSALLFIDPPRRILLLGLGGGALIHFLLHHHPQLQLEVVEKSRTIIDLAHKYFNIPIQNNLHIHHCDADSFCRQVRKNADRYDLILIDIFDADAMATPMYEQTFYRNLCKALTKNGVLAANVWGSNTREFTLAYMALRNGCSQRPLQLKVPEKGNIICLGFRQPLSRTTLVRARHTIPSAEQQYSLSFSRYWKQLLRNNTFLLLRAMLT